MTYTKDDLKAHQVEYESNYLMMAAAKGTKDHKKYVTQERLLNRKGVLIRKALGMIATDPCTDQTCVGACNEVIEAGKCKLI